MSRASFVVALDTRSHAIAQASDVVFPVAAAPEKSGTFLNWEGRSRPFDQAVRPTNLMSDARVLSAIADELDVSLGLADPVRARRQMAEFEGWQGAQVEAPTLAAPESPSSPAQRSVARHLAAADRSRFAAAGRALLLPPPRPLLRRCSSQSAATAMGRTDGELVVVSGAAGSLLATIVVTDVVDEAVVVTGDFSGALGGYSGDLVSLAAGGVQ